MTDTTPSALRTPVLRALGARSGHRAGVPVRGSDVIPDALALAGIPADDTEAVEKATRNASWVATQVLRKEGLLGDGDKRGFWSLTPAGVSALTGVDPDPVPAPVDAAPAPVPATPDPVEATASTNATIPRSRWEDDPAGVPLYTRRAKDTYEGDAYILSLAISQTRCFGGYTESESVCQTCPVAASCRSRQHVRLSTIATKLRRRDDEGAAQAPAGASPAPATRSGVTPRISDESLEDVLRDLETSDPAPATAAQVAQAPSDTGMRMAAQVESRCYACGGIIKEREMGVFVPSSGMRHEKCP